MNLGVIIINDKFSELKFNHERQFSVIPQAPLFERFLILFGINSQRILIPTDKMFTTLELGWLATGLNIVIDGLMYLLCLFERIFVSQADNKVTIPTSLSLSLSLSLSHTHTHADTRMNWKYRFKSHQSTTLKSNVTRSQKRQSRLSHVNCAKRCDASKKR